MNWKNTFLILMTMIGVVLAIDIDGQLAVIKNDCYERMAIGQKLSPKQTYKTFDYNTVLKCEMECTQQNDMCRAFSFGIGPKGNGTCLLSKISIRETADLKPIGTINDPDFDLYTKKIDCKIVIDQPEFVGSQKPADQIPDYSTKPLHVGQDYHDENDRVPGNRYPQTSNSNLYNSPIKPDKVYGGGYHYNKPTNYIPQPPTQQGDDIHHVQTLVSIASGPQSVLHPVHDILVSGDSYGQHRPQHSAGHTNIYEGSTDNLPPFRPTSLHHPYDDCRPQGSSFDNYGRPPRPNLSYGDSRPEVDYDYSNVRPGQRPELDYPSYKPIAPDSGYEPPHEQSGPLYLPSPDNDRPDPNYGTKPFNHPSLGYGIGSSTIDRRKYQSFNQFSSYESENFGFPSHRPTDPDLNYYDHYNRPDPSRPNRYGSIIPHPSDYLLIRPNSENYNRVPSKPIQNGNDDGYNKPKPSNNGYNQNGNNRQPRPDNIDHNNNYDYGKLGSSRPNQDDPNGRPLKPSTEINRYDGVDYSHKQYGKPGEYLGVNGEYGHKIVSHNIGHNGERITSIITELKDVDEVKAHLWNLWKKNEFTPIKYCVCVEFTGRICLNYMIRVRAVRQQYLCARVSTLLRTHNTYSPHNANFY